MSRPASTTDFHHRGGLLADTRRLRPDPSFIERIGGPKVVRQVIERFYEHGILRDPQLEPMFARGLDRSRSGDFFIEWLGGPPLYTDNPRHGRGIWRSHKRFHITRAMVGRWLGHMKNALDACGVERAVRVAIMSALVPLAHGLLDSAAGVPAHPGRWPREAELRFRGKTYQSPLFFAVETARECAAAGDIPALRAALDEDPRIGLYRGSHGRTVLWTAAAAGRLAVVDLLLQHSDIGAVLDIPGCAPMPVDFVTPYQPDRDGYHQPLLMTTPVAVASGNGHHRIAERLLACGARRDLFSAAYLGDLPTVQALCERDPTVIDAPDPADDFHAVTALHHAVAGGRLAVVRWLIEHSAAVVPHSRWLLTLAALGEHRDILASLLDSGANARATLSLGPLDRDSWPIAELLVAHGADLDHHPIHGSLLHHVCRRALVDGDDAAQVRIARALLALGADVDARGPRGDTPLHAAVRSGSTELVELLLAHGASTHAEDHNGHTPLISVRTSPAAIDPIPRLRALLRHGADIDARNLMGESLLLYYVRVARTDVVEWLLAHGADPELGNREGVSPRTLAAHNGIGDLLVREQPPPR